MEFFHISKSGGTSFCGFPNINGCSAATDTNCLLPELDDYPRWTRPTREAGGIDFSTRGAHKRAHTCSQRASFLEKKGISFYAKEYVLNTNPGSTGPALCPQFAHVIMLRRPAARLPSHLSHILFGLQEISNGTFLNSTFDQASVDHWCALAPGAVDNYAVRVLAGEDAFLRPCGGLEPQHLQQAKMHLHKFDVVLLTDVLDRETRVLKWGLGWQLQPDHLGVTPPTHKLFNRKLLESELRPVRDWQSLDVALYNRAVLLHTLDEFFFGVASLLFPQPPASVCACGK